MRSKFTFQSALALTAIALASVVGLQADKIKFTDQTESLPKPDMKQFEEEARRDVGSRSASPESSLPSAVPQRAAPPSAAAVKKYEELLDKKKNWLENGATEFRKGVTAEDLAGFDDIKLGGDKRKKSSMERYFDAAGNEQKRLATKEKTNAKREEQSLRDNSAEEDDLALEPNGLSDFNLKNFLQKDTTPKETADNPFKSFAAPSFQGFNIQPDTKKIERIKAEKERVIDFQKMIQTRAGAPTAMSGIDPINNLVDPTRQENQPVTPGGGLGGLRGISAAPPAEDFKSKFTGPTAAGSSLTLDGFNQRATMAGSLSPVVPPPTPQRFQAQPAVLDIPRRQF